MKKSMKSLVGSFIALVAVLVCFLFLWVISVEIGKIHSLMKYLKHPYAAWIATHYSFSLIFLTLAYFSPIVLKFGLCFKSKFSKFTSMIRIVHLISLYLSLVTLTLLVSGPPRILGAPKVDDIFLTKYSKLFIKLGLEHVDLMAKLTMIKNCAEDGIVELIRYPFNVKYATLAVVLIFLCSMLAILTYKLETSLNQS